MADVLYFSSWWPKQQQKWRRWLATHMRSIWWEALQVVRVLRSSRKVNSRNGKPKRLKVIIWLLFWMITYSINFEIDWKNMVLINELLIDIFKLWRRLIVKRGSTWIFRAKHLGSDLLFVFRFLLNKKKINVLLTAIITKPRKSWMYPVEHAA